MAEHAHGLERWLQQEGEALLYAPDDTQAQNIMLATVNEWVQLEPPREPPLADDANPFFMLDVVQRQQAIIREYQQRCLGPWPRCPATAGEENVDG